MEEEYIREFRRRIIRIQDSRRVFGRYKKRVWRRRQRIGEGGRVKKIQTERKDNRGVCAEIQENSKRKWSKMAHFIATTEEMTAKGLARLFRDNIWKLHRLPKNLKGKLILLYIKGL